MAQEDPQDKNGPEEGPKLPPPGSQEELEALERLVSLDPAIDQDELYLKKLEKEEGEFLSKAQQEDPVFGPIARRVKEIDATAEREDWSDKRHLAELKEYLAENFGIVIDANSIENIKNWDKENAEYSYKNIEPGKVEITREGGAEISDGFVDYLIGNALEVLDIKDLKLFDVRDIQKIHILPSREITVTIYAGRVAKKDPSEIMLYTTSVYFSGSKPFKLIGVRGVYNSQPINYENGV